MSELQPISNYDLVADIAELEHRVARAVESFGSAPASMLQKLATCRELQHLRALHSPAPQGEKCGTCGDHGLVSGHMPDGSMQDDPCPDCTVQQPAEAVGEAGEVAKAIAELRELHAWAWEREQYAQADACLRAVALLQRQPIKQGEACPTCKERPGLVRVGGNPMLGSWDVCPDCDTCHECKGTGKRPSEAQS